MLDFGLLIFHGFGSMTGRQYVKIAKLEIPNYSEPKIMVQNDGTFMPPNGHIVPSAHYYSTWKICA